MYLLTTPDRSVRYRSTSSSWASTSRGQRLADPARPGQQHAQPEPARGRLGEPPRLVDLPPVAYLVGDGVQQAQFLLAEDQVGPARLGLQALRDSRRGAGG